MKDDVKRWNAASYVYNDDNGAYVLAADYDRLRAERDAMAASHARLVEVVTRFRDRSTNLDEIMLAERALSLARDLPADGVREAAKKAVAELDPAMKPNDIRRVRDMLLTALEPRP